MQTAKRMLKEQAAHEVRPYQLALKEMGELEPDEGIFDDLAVDKNTGGVEGEEEDVIDIDEELSNQAQHFKVKLKNKALKSKKYGSMVKVGSPLVAIKQSHARAMSEKERVEKLK